MRPFATAPAFATALAVAVATAQPALRAQTPPVELAPITTAVRAQLEQVRQKRDLPGIGAAFVLPDGRLGEVAVGHVDAERKQPLTTAHRQFSGSIGKTYCAVLCLRLVQDGVLGLDDPLRKHLGARPWFARLPNHERVTIRQLLQHQSGIPEHVWKPAFHTGLLADPDRAWKPEECVAFVLDDEPLFAPGEKWAYADTNYLLVGLAIEQAAGRPYYDLLRARVLEPLGLRDTLPADRRDLPDLANGFASGIAIHRGETVVDGRYFVNPIFEWTGGGIVSTTADLARFGRAALLGDAVPEARRADLTRFVPADPRVAKGYGLGVMQIDSPHGPAVGHTGIMPGHLSAVIHYQEPKLTVALQTNTDDGRKVGRLERLAHDVAATVIERAALRPAAGSGR